MYVMERNTQKSVRFREDCFERESLYSLWLAFKLMFYDISPGTFEADLVYLPFYKNGYTLLYEGYYYTDSGSCSPLMTYLILASDIMAGETGGTGRGLPLRAPLIPLPGWDPGNPIYNENEPFYFS